MYRPSQSHSNVGAFIDNLTYGAESVISTEEGELWSCVRL